MVRYLKSGKSREEKENANQKIKETVENILKKIEKGGIIVEGTAGNTGIGLAVVCKEFGLNLKIVIPKTQSVEKKQTLKKLGAELIEVDAVPYANPKNYIKQSKKIADELSKKNNFGVVWGNQFDNIVNTNAHIETTANEIWSQTAGKIDGFTCSVGTGGTISGVAKRLKEEIPNIKIVGVDPEGSILGGGDKIGSYLVAVSYTHLTLPTKA